MLVSWVTKLMAWMIIYIRVFDFQISTSKVRDALVPKGQGESTSARSESVMIGGNLNCRYQLNYQKISI